MSTKHRLTIRDRIEENDLEGSCSCGTFGRVVPTERTLGDIVMTGDGRKAIEAWHREHRRIVATTEHRRPGPLSLAVYVALAVLALVCGMALVGVYGVGPFLLALGMGVPLGFLGAFLGISRSGS